MIQNLISHVVYVNIFCPHIKYYLNKMLYKMYSSDVRLTKKCTSEGKDFFSDKISALASRSCQE